MLVLSRKQDQTIYIGPDITIYVVKVTGTKVSLGIDCPSSVNVLRGELMNHALPTHKFLGSLEDTADSWQCCNPACMRTYEVGVGRRLKECPYCGTRNGCAIEKEETDASQEV